MEDCPLVPKMAVGRVPHIAPVDAGISERPALVAHALSEVRRRVLFRHTFWRIALTGSQITIKLVRTSGEGKPDRNDEEVMPRLQQGFWILAARNLTNKCSLIRLEFSLLSDKSSLLLCAGKWPLTR